MNSTQEFLVLESGEALSVYGVGDLPGGTVVGEHARRLRVVGHGWVTPPSPRLTPEEWARWTEGLSQAGYTTTVEPFWK